MQFFFEVLVGGCSSGVMYSLVALGFVLIYKASGRLQLRPGRDGVLRRADLRRLVERGMPTVARASRSTLA